jgi:catechol 2,3-dioxygenase-like lactoylglutathione lyase family enzyme
VAGLHEYGPDYYGGFLLDPDGNSAEACHHDNLRRDGGIVDHLWIRVTDLAAARAFYETIAGHAALRKDHDTPERVQFRGESGSFSRPRYHPGYFAAYVLDPDGNNIEVVNHHRE